MSPARHTILLLLWLAGAHGGCSAQNAGECKIDSDCASGHCDQDGQCNTIPLVDGGSAVDAATDARISACGGSVDDQIARDELPMQAGSKANFRVASAASFATAGQEVDGARLWDLDRGFAGDSDVVVELYDTQGSWYDELFPDASYAGLLAQDSELLGIFRLDDDGLYLLGVVSPEAGVARTELSYDPPALLMPVPLAEGDSWTTDSSVKGLASGFVSAYSERYEGLADASGTLQTPYGAFRVIRNQMLLTRTVGFSTTQTIQYSFVSECAGIVASLLSQVGEDDVDFSEVAELRRLIP